MVACGFDADASVLHVHSHRMETHAVPCCFKAPVRKEGQRIVTRFQLQDDIEVRLPTPTVLAQNRLLLRLAQRVVPTVW